MIKRYQDDVIEQLWAEWRKIELWQHVETAVARVQAQLGIIPSTAVEDLVNHPGFAARAKSVSDVESEEEKTGHDFVAFLSVWRQTLHRHSADDGARFLHYGLTSSDVQDTAMGLRLLSSSNYLRAGLIAPLTTLLADLGDQHLGTPRVARTHGQYAEPTTLGVKILEWFELIRRADERLRYATHGVAVGKLSGPVGTYAHNPPEVEAAALAQLGLGVALGSSQVVTRDRLAAWAYAVAGLATACEQIALDFWLLAQSGVEEVREGTRVGSSSMPHKRNPAKSEKIRGMAGVAQEYSNMLQRWPLALERDLTNSARERIAIPGLLHSTAHVLKSTDALLRGAGIDAKRMLENLDDADRAPYTSGVALALVRDGETREWAESAAASWASFESQPDSPPLLADRPETRPAMTYEYYLRNLEHLRGLFDQFNADHALED